MCYVFKINICLLRNFFNFNFNFLVGLKIEYIRSVFDVKRLMDFIVIVNYEMVVKIKKVVVGFKM